ncbi:MAG: helix-turn-helix transcriptional regulator [Phycisphaeraceae bacterium]|nr:helix-turn-helix transcriptional regulator [Phycisphaeraceae bacterium]
MSALPTMEVLRAQDRAAAVLDSTRQRLLSELATPDSASGLARRLGLPRQRLNYHLRELEKAGLVKQVDERRKGNCVERIVQATAASYLISPEVIGPLGTDPSRLTDRFSSAYLVAVAAKTITDVAELRARSERAGKGLATLTIQIGVRFANAEDRNAFAEDLANEVARLAAEYHDESAPQGRLYNFVVGGYPAITRVEPAAAEPEPSTMGRTPDEENQA